MLEGISAIRARIAEIQSYSAQTSAPAPVAAPRERSSPTATSGRTFASTLSAATGALSADLSGAVKTTPGAYGAMRVPADLRRYGNGRIPADALTSIGVGDHRLFRDAALAFVRMRSDAAAAGIDIGVADAYRSFDEQVDLVRRKGLYSNGGLAASPGSSNHGWGLAIDVDVDARGQAWLAENGSRYGFVEDTPREPWHWGYRPASPSY